MKKHKNREDLRSVHILPFCVDLLLFELCTIVVSSFILDKMHFMHPYDFLIGVTVFCLYFGIGDSKLTGGSTPGKRIFGLKVINKNSQLLTIQHSMSRALFVSPVFCIDGRILYLSNSYIVLYLCSFSVWLFLIFLFSYATFGMTDSAIMPHDCIFKTKVCKRQHHESAQYTEVSKKAAKIVKLSLIVSAILALVASIGDISRKAVRIKEFDNLKNVELSRLGFRNATIKKGRVQWINERKITEYEISGWQVSPHHTVCESPLMKDFIEQLSFVRKSPLDQFVLKFDEFVLLPARSTGVLKHQCIVIPSITNEFVESLNQSALVSSETASQNSAYVAGKTRFRIAQDLNRDFKTNIFDTFKILKTISFWREYDYIMNPTPVEQSKKELVYELSKTLRNKISADTSEKTNEIIGFIVEDSIHNKTKIKNVRQLYLTSEPTVDSEKDLKEISLIGPIAAPPLTMHWFKWIFRKREAIDSVHLYSTNEYEDGSVRTVHFATF